MKSKNQRIINIIILMCIFLLGSVLHYLYGCFSKSIDVLPDEIRYYSIARSIFRGDGLTFRGVATDYQKMGYTLFLVPFFLIKNGILRMKAITLANSLVMMLSVFPLYGIMNKLKISNKIKMVFLAIFIVFPDLMYSATFMAEVLYWPILLLFIYLWMVNREKSSYIISVILGIICYVGYSTKEIFLAILLGVVAFEILFPIVEHLFNNQDKTRKLKDNYKSKRLIQLLITVVSFAVMYLIIKLIFFRGLGNSYDQTSIDAIASPEKFGYMVYGFFYYLAAIMIACFVITIILPGMLYRQHNERARELYVGNILWILSSVATIAYTITVREDFGDIIPRLHFRYIGPLIIIALIIYIYSIDNKKIEIRIKKSVVITIAVTLFVSFGLFRGVTVITGVDQFILDWVYYITEHLGAFWGIFLVDSIIVIAVVIVVTLLAKGKNKHAIIITLVTLGLLGIFNSVTAKERLVKYMLRDEDLVQETIELNDKLNSVDGGILYVGEAYEYSDTCKCVDTFIDKNKTMYYVSKEGLEKTGLGVYDVNELSIPMQLNLWKMNNDNIESIDYVVENTTNTEEFDIKINNLTQVPELSGKYYTVYKNNDRNKLSISKSE